MKKTIEVLMIIVICFTLFAITTLICNTVNAEEKEFIIKESEVNIVLQYLANKPYIEVYKTVDFLTKLKPLETNDIKTVTPISK